eukprot:COSAG02_NODE_8377_length_2592_cov_4.426394_2_plen_149_part_00
MYRFHVARTNGDAGTRPGRRRSCARCVCRSLLSHTFASSNSALHCTARVRLAFVCWPKADWFACRHETDRRLVGRRRTNLAAPLPVRLLLVIPRRIGGRHGPSEPIIPGGEGETAPLDPPPLRPGVIRAAPSQRRSGVLTRAIKTGQF